VFKQLFTTMNEMLDEVAAQYPAAAGIQKQELEEKLRTLKAMSDTFIEEWLLFEEKLAAFYGHQHAAAPTDVLDPELGDQRSDGFIRGQGYYKLMMFSEAIREFADIVRKQPDFTLARLYLAMSFLQKGEVSESYSHFYFLSQCTENDQIKAISCSAMGCIQLQDHNVDKAIEYFNLAFQSDPGSVEPLLTMGLCYEKKGQLGFYRPSRN
jgi:tetratricopeptide (TPR) repeat protein